MDVSALEAIVSAETEALISMETLPDVSVSMAYTPVEPAAAGLMILPMVQVSAAADSADPPLLVSVTTCPDTAVAMEPPIVEQAPPEAPETSKPAGNVTLIFPLLGIGFTVVKEAVAIPEALALNVAGSTLVEVRVPAVMVSAETDVLLSIEAFDDDIVSMLYVPVDPET